MKKVAIILLTVFLFTSIFAVVVLAEESQVIDLSEYDDETFIKLYEQVKDELVARHIEKTAHLKASPTPYVIGRDIPAGDYLLQKSAPDGEGGVGLATLNEDFTPDKVKIDTYIDADEDFSIYITAEEGEVLIVELDCDLTISTGVKFE